MKAIIQISISHSNSIDLSEFLEKIKLASEEVSKNYMSDAKKYENKTLEMEIETFTRMPLI